MDTVLAMLASAVIIEGYWIWRLHIRIQACVVATAMSMGKIDEKFDDVTANF